MSKKRSNRNKTQIRNTDSFAQAIVDAQEPAQEPATKAPAGNRRGPKCPKCGRPMLVRNTKIDKEGNVRILYYVCDGVSESHRLRERDRVNEIRSIRRPAVRKCDGTMRVTESLEPIKII